MHKGQINIKKLNQLFEDYGMSKRKLSKDIGMAESTLRANFNQTKFYKEISEKNQRNIKLYCIDFCIELMDALNFED